MLLYIKRVEKKKNITLIIKEIIKIFDLKIINRSEILIGKITLETTVWFSILFFNFFKFLEL